ncbi:hypothetical protein ACWCO3_21140, partial [Micromonospora sp. NPDC002411]
MSDSFAVLQLDDLPARRCSCGTTRRGFIAESDGQASVHLLQVQDAVTHHHRVATEYYIVLAGEGEVELDGEALCPLSGLTVPPPGASARHADDSAAVR